MTSALWDDIREVEAWLSVACEAARPVPSLAASNAAAERTRLAEQLRRGEHPVPAFEEGRHRVSGDAYRALDQARLLARLLPVAHIYLDKLEELEIDLAILDAWGDPRRVRPLSARRYGVGDDAVETAERTYSLYDVAVILLSTLPEEPAPERLLPATAPLDEPSVERWILQAALALGLEVSVRVEPRLASLAASGERTVFLADRTFSELEARRLVAHEVFGHLVVAANARAQRLKLLGQGLAGAFADQEGVALFLEEALGVMCPSRMRVLAVRVLATHWLHDGAAFGETAVRLVRDYGLEPDAAVAVAERAYRGGGVARDAGYLAGWLRVRNAIRRGHATLHELRTGRVGVRDVPGVRALADLGLATPPPYRPSLALSRRLTASGTSAETSPPSFAASLTRFELT